MGYAQTTQWGRVMEVGVGFGVSCSLNTTPTDVVIGTITTPAKSSLDNATLIGAYLDTVIGSFQNTNAGANYILSDAGHPYIGVALTGHTAFTAYSDLIYSLYAPAQATYAGYRIYGNVNWAGNMQYSHSGEVTLMNTRSLLNNLIPNDFHFICRMYLR